MKKLNINIKYILMYAWSLDKLYLLLRIPITIVSSLKPFILIVFPAKIIELIMDGSEIGEIQSCIIEMALFQFISGLLLEFFNRWLTNRYNWFEYKHALSLGRKIMSVSFPLTEDSDVLNHVERIKGIGYIEKSFESLFSLVSYLITIVGLIWVLSKVNILIIATIAVILGANIVLRRKQKLYNYQWQKEAAPYRRRNDYILRLMYGFQYGKEVRVNEMEPYLTGKYEEHSIEYLARLKKVGEKYFIINNLTSLASSVQMAVVYMSLLGSTLIGVISIAEFTKYISAVNTLSSSLIKVSDSFAEIRNNFNYVEDLKSFFDLDQDKLSSVNKALEVGDITIEFKNVSFKYPDTSQYALENVSVKILPNSKITIVGLNGSGKTTFVKLMLGLYKPTSGYVYVNGVDINEIVPDEYWKHFACAFQDFRLFSYPIRENIVLSQDYDEKRLKDILDQCGLTEAVNKLPLNLETPIYKFLDKSGVEFSGGENQKIAIARAVYKNADIVILDEPLASLDPVSEYNMYYGIRKMVNDRTCVFVSHRLSLAKESDSILVFDNGHLVESGTHDELMKIVGGKYADMYHKQSSFYVKVGSNNDEWQEN